MNDSIARRSVLRLAGGCAALACVGCERGAVDEPKRRISAGNVTAIAIGTLRVVDGPVVLARDAGGLYAMSSVCTHAGCALDATNGTVPGGLDCGCHGSRFDGDGNVTRGPAGRALVHLLVEVDAAGAVTVRADLPPVAADARTAVPG
jgi:Rieske Fe-S protein